MPQTIREEDFMRCLLVAAAVIVLGSQAVAWCVPAVGAAQTPLAAARTGENKAPANPSMRPLAQTVLPDVTKRRLYLKLLRVRVPSRSTARYSASEGMLFAVSGPLQVETGGTHSTLQEGQGMYIPAGGETAYSAGEEPAEFLHFLLATTGEVDALIDALPATVTSLYRTTEPIGDLQAGPYALALSELVFPPGMPRNAPHYLNGVALYYVLSGTGQFTAQDTVRPQPEGSVIYEPAKVLHQWANPGSEPVRVVVASLAPQGQQPILFGPPPSPRASLASPEISPVGQAAVRYSTSSRDAGEISALTERRFLLGRVLRRRCSASGKP